MRDSDTQPDPYIDAMAAEEHVTEGEPETGAALIAAERRRQVESEGWTPEHDASHHKGELARAAACYALAAAAPFFANRIEPGLWPPLWDFKAADPVRMLVKAGALIAAEIDRQLATKRSLTLVTMGGAVVTVTVDTSLPTRILTAHLKHLKQQGRSQGTIDARCRHLRRMAAVIPVPLLEATPEHLAAWREGLNVKGNTAVQYAAHARGFYAWAVQTGRIASNPADGLALPHLVRGLPRPAGEGELLDALTHAPLRVRPWLVLAAWAGLRAKEIALLRRERVLDTASPPVILVAADATKGRRERIVPMSPFVVAEMRVCTPRGTGFVFPRHDGLPGANRPWTVSHVANDYLREYGFTLHQLRHRFGTAAYRACHDLRTVQELMGHADPATTAGYAAFDQAAAVNAVNALPAPGRLSSVEATG